MAGLQAIFSLVDDYSSKAYSIIQSSDRAAAKVEKLDAAVTVLNHRLDVLKNPAVTKQGFSNIEIGANKARNSVDQLNKKVERFIGLASKISRTAFAVGVTAEVTGYIDSQVLGQARLGLVADTMDVYDQQGQLLGENVSRLERMAELNDMIYASADRARTRYSEMLTAVNKMGILAGKQFSSSNELVGFTELLTKTFKISGSSETEQRSAMYQLTQAMAAGKLQGDEFRSILENAPMLAKYIEDYTKDWGMSMKEMSAEGVLTADVIKAAVFQAAQDIEDRYAKIPMTFADVFNKIANTFNKTMQPVSQEIINMLNSEKAQKTVELITMGIAAIGYGLLGLLDIITTVGSVAYDIISVIYPVLIAIAIVAIPVLLVNFALLFASIIRGAIKALGALFLVPTPLLIIAVVIGIVIAACLAFGDVVIAVVTIVVGIFGLFFDFVVNGFLFLLNMLAIFVNFLGNCFISPVNAIKLLFAELAISVVSFIEDMATAIEQLINSIPGVEISITGAITGIKNSLADYIGGMEKEGLNSLTLEDFMKDFDFTSTWMDAGNAIGSGIVDAADRLKGAVSGALGGLPGTLPNPDDYKLDWDSLMDGIDSAGGLPVTNGDGKGGKLKTELDNEDLTYLVELAEREYTVKYNNNTLAPQIQVTFGDVRETADVDKVAGHIVKIMREEIAVAGEGQ